MAVSKPRIASPSAAFVVPNVFLPAQTELQGSQQLPSVAELIRRHVWREEPAQPIGASVARLCIVSHRKLPCMMRRPNRPSASSFREPRTLRRCREAASSSPTLLVVGGGLAGLGTALAAARAGLRVRVVDAAPRRPGEPWRKTTNEDETELPMDAGFKGIWAEYPNMLALLDEFVPGGSNAALTRPTASGFYSGRGLEVNSQVFGRLPPLPAPLGTLAYSSPLFSNVPVSAQLSALPLFPRLLDALSISPSDDSTGGLDDMSAEQLFLEAGLSPDLYDAFLRPVLQALLFRPPSELSAFVTLRVLWCYVFKTQRSFDVRWPRRPLADLLLKPLVAEIERLGGCVEAGTRLADIELDELGRAMTARLERSGGAVSESVPVDAIVLAAGIVGTTRTLEGCNAQLQHHLSTELSGLRQLQTIECTAVRLALDRICPTAFSSNVLSGLDGLTDTGATFFMLEQLQHSYVRDYILSAPGGDRLRGRSIVAVDFYGTDRGMLARMEKEDIPDFALSLLRSGEPRAFKDASLATGVEAPVLRAKNAATHFAPGSRKNRPRQSTSVPNIFFAGDYVKGLEHGAEGLSQERALVSGYSAANMAMDYLESLGRAQPRGLHRQQVQPLSEDEPQVQLLRALWRSRR